MTHDFFTHKNNFNDKEIVFVSTMLETTKTKKNPLIIAWKYTAGAYFPNKTLSKSRHLFSVRVCLNKVKLSFSKNTNTHTHKNSLRPKTTNTNIMTRQIMI